MSNGCNFFNVFEAMQCCRFYLCLEFVNNVEICCVHKCKLNACSNLFNSSKWMHLKSDCFCESICTYF